MPAILNLGRIVGNLIPRWSFFALDLPFPLGFFFGGFAVQVIIFPISATFASSTSAMPLRSARFPDVCFVAVVLEPTLLILEP